MKIKRIEIEFIEFDEGEDHTKRAVFSEGKWTFDGPVYGRIIIALHDIWKRLREEVNS